MFSAGLHPVCLDEYISFGMFQCPTEEGIKARPRGDADLYLAQALREDEELLILLQSFIEIKQCRH